MKAILAVGGIWLIKPNELELAELVAKPIKDSPEQLTSAAGELGDKVENVLISRGKKGALLVSRDDCRLAQYRGKDREVHSTVGCGDYLLAGFLNGWRQHQDVDRALEKGIIAGTARAWSLTEQTSWSKVSRKIRVDISQLVMPPSCGTGI